VRIGQGRPSSVPEQPCVARQPILDRNGNLFAYELLFRRSQLAQSCDVSSNDACARVITDAVLSIGLDTLTGGKLAFINLTRDMVLSGAAALLPKDRVVVELLEDVTGDAAVVEACQSLKQSGYQIALDDFSYSNAVANLVPLADYIKVDVLTNNTASARSALIGAVNPRTRLLAEKVETPEEHKDTLSEGFAYFQGYFFGRPAVREVKRIAARPVAYATLLVKLSKPDISVFELENVIKQDTSLSYRVLRALNSAATPLRVEIASIRQAIILLGRDTIRRWASLWAIASMNERTHPELVASSIIRARCCEMVDASSRHDPGTGFLLGMCSLLDAILEQPMEAVVSQLPLAADVRWALLGEQNERRALLDCVIAYERGEWDRFEQLAARAGVSDVILRSAYQEALRWTRELSHAARAA
jgi:EAL and modified HD-GYP domain-containing signal transduction protein